MDLSIFIAILVIAELAVHYAAVWLPGGALFTVSFMLTITLIVMVRWGWPSVFYALLSGVLYCALNKGGLTSYLVYGIGNCFVMFTLIPLKLIGTDKIVSKWWSAVLLVLGGWLCVYLGRSVVWTVCYAVQPVAGAKIYSGFIDFAAFDLVPLALTIIIILVLRRFDGMFVDQKSFLKKLDESRRDDMRKAMYGDELAELDEETLNILHHDDGLY